MVSCHLLEYRRDSSQVSCCMFVDSALDRNYFITLIEVGVALHACTGLVPPAPRAIKSKRKLPYLAFQNREITFHGI